MDTSERSANWILKRISAFLLLVVIVVSVYGTIVFPETIPVHFSAGGEADAWGSPAMLLIFPVISTILYFLFTWLAKIPSKLNYPVVVTKVNAERLYMLSRRMLLVLLLCINLLFLIIIGGVYMVVYGYADGLHPWFFFLALALTLGPVGYYIFKMMTIRN